jgi:DNA-binding NarL/FixJ family response regulator
MGEPMADRKTVLIVDPSPIFRRTLKSVIQTSEAGVDVHEADSADQAAQVLNREPPDVIFIDIALPGHKGIEFIRTMKEVVPESYVVVLTSHDSEEHEAASIQKGADYFLSKDRSGGLQLVHVINTVMR